jgi:beta-lactamase class A
MKSKILLSALILCLGASDLLYAKGHYYQRPHKRHRHHRVYIVRPPVPKPRVHVHTNRVDNRQHCHGTMC